MSAERKVAIVTGASQGIGAALVGAYRKRGYGVVATARAVKPTDDADILAVPGDIADRKTAQQAISEGLARVRTHRHTYQQCGHLHRQAIHGLYDGRL